MKSLLLAALLSLTGLAQAADPATVPAVAYDESANAKEDLKKALVAARADQRKVLLVFGANWCPDCRVLDQTLKSERNASLVAKEFAVVKVDIGRYDKNMDLSRAYGEPTKKGIPAVVVLSPDNEVLYATKAGELANTRKMSEEGVYGFFRDMAAQAQAKK
ncbi:thioredoxin family protein [Chitinimonas lacunae]|uniref:Thioredoxin family protein n=1 Tax=Chitinimonas lacunae TaxID=1963018 RepID=A0ABV8MNN6_9NEIS